jgi:SAM-dependent methyltransferase
MTECGRSATRRWQWYQALVTDANPEGVLPGSAESRSPEDFDQMYSGTPPWDIGRPQPVFLALAEAGAIRGRVLDAGCGTGEHVLMAAARGLVATGIDAAPTAITIAQRKAAERGLAARFLVWDALRLGELGEHFDTVLDSGLFHVFDDERRARYVEAVGAVLPPGGRYLMCCFSDRQPGEWGPRRVRQEEIRATFAEGWRVESIEAVEFDTTLDPPVAQAWLSTITHSA